MGSGMDDQAPTFPQTREEEQAIVRAAMERYKVSADFDRPFKDRRLINFFNLHNKIPLLNWPFWSEDFEPETQMNTTETVERIMQGLFPRERMFDLKPCDGQDELATEKTRELVQLDLNRAKYKLIKYRQCAEGVSYGNGVEFHYVGLDIVDLWNRQPLFDDFGVLIGYDDNVDSRVEWCPRSKVISVFDCYPATTGSLIHEMPDFRHRELVPLAAVQAMKGWRNTDRLKGFLAVDGPMGRAGLDDEDLAYDLYERLRALGLSVSDGVGSVKGAGAIEYVELLIETLAAPGRPGCAHWRIIGNRQELLLDEPFPQRHKRKPYSEFKYLERSANLWRADGLPELIDPLQMKINLRSNQASDAIIQNHRPPTLVGRDALLTDQHITEFQSRPDRMIPCGDVNQVRVLERPHAGMDLFGDLDMTRASIQRISKLFDATRNIAGARTGVGEAAKTATGLGMITQMMNTAVNFKLLLNEEVGIKDGLEIYLSLRQQLQTRDTEIPMTDPTNPIYAKAGIRGMVPISAMDVAGRWEVQVLGSSQTLDTPELIDAATQWVKEGFEMEEVRVRLKQMDLWLWKGEMIKIPAPRRFVRSDEEQAHWEQEQLQKQLAGASAARQALNPAVAAAEA